MPAKGAFSYYSQRSESSVNTGRRERIETIEGPSSVFGALGRHRFLTWTVCIVLGVGFVYAMLLKPEPRIVLLQDATTAYFLQDEAVYRQAAAETLGRSLFNRNKLTVDTSAVRLDLIKKYPEIKNVTVTLPIIGQEPRINIEPYRPSFLLSTTASNAFLLDTTGRALASLNQIPDPEKLGVPTVQDRSGLQVTLGNRALPSTTVSFTQSVLKALDAGGVEVASVVLPAAAYELDVYVAGTPYFVKFNVLNDPLQQAGTYLAAKGRLASEKTTPAQYFDVRVPERAYYR